MSLRLFAFTVCLSIATGHEISLFTYLFVSLFFAFALAQSS